MYRNIIFISGSRDIRRLNNHLRERMSFISSPEYRVLIGDANGVDKQVQKFLLDINKTDVVVYCSGDECRNNLGDWEEKHVVVDRVTKDRSFYEVKDRAMTNDTDFGLVIWDKKSIGSLNNIIRLLMSGKRSVVLLPDCTEFRIYEKVDVQRLFDIMDSEDLKHAKEKMPGSIKRFIEDVQGSLF